MAISWDYMAGVKGTQAGMKQAADSNLATQRAANERNRQINIRNAEIADKERAAEAQEQVIRQAEVLDNESFFEGQEKSVTYAGLNSVFDKSTQDLVNTYTDIKNNKDMDSSERARLMRTMMDQIPMLKNGKALIDKQMAAFSQASQTGDVSSAMDPAYQQVYADLIAGEFDGGINFEGDAMVFSGKTSTGQDIHLPLNEFALKLPKVVTKGGTLMDSTDGYLDTLKQEIDAYNKTGKNAQGLRKPPEFDPEAKRNAIETILESKGNDAMYIYGMDTMNLSRETIDSRVDALIGTKQTINTLEASVFKSLPTKDDDGNPFPPGYYDNLLSTTDVMTKADAREQVLDDMISQEVSVLRGVYNSKVGNAIAPKSELSLVDNTYQGIVDEGSKGMEVSMGKTLGLKNQDFNVAKGTGFDNIATNLTEGFNDSGEYIVSFEQKAKYEGEEPLTTSYNLSTKGGAKDFLLARYENEQGRMGATSAQKTEAKKKAIKLAPIYAKNMRDYSKLIQDAEKDAAKAAEDEKRLENVKNVLSQIDSFSEGRGGSTEKVNGIEF